MTKLLDRHVSSLRGRTTWPQFVSFRRIHEFREVTVDRGVVGGGERPVRTVPVALAVTIVSR